MNLTTLGERRLRGDLIETFKIVNGLVEYGNDMFRLSRSDKILYEKQSIVIIIMIHMFLN